jgi:hypothetical protein
VLAIERRWVNGLLGLRELEHTSNDGYRAGRWMLHLRQHLACVRLRMRQHIAQPLNRRGWDGGAFQQLQPVGRRLLGYNVSHQAIENVFMLLAGTIGGKAWVTGQVRAVDSLAELAIERARVQRNDNIPVAGLIGTIGHNGVVARPHRLRIVPGKEIQFGEVPQEAHHAVVQPDIDDLPAARALPLLECRKNPQRGKQATSEVAHWQAQLDRWAARLPSHAHRAGHGLGDDIVGGAVTQGPGLPETRDGADDQPRIGSQQTVRREPEPC